MDDKEFEDLINKALDSLPTEFSEKLENVSVVIQDWPSIRQGRAQQEKGRTGLLLGLYEGIPHTRRGVYGIGGVLPDKITIFKYPILMISKSQEEISKNVKETVIHEIAHHFGMSDEELHHIEKAKREKALKG